MKRIWLGIGILVVFLFLGSWSSHGMNKRHVPLSNKLETAASAVLAGDWNKGISLAKEATAQWKNCWNNSAILADHTPMDDIDGIFARLDIFEKAGNKEAFAACCAELSKRIAAMAEAHRFTWWNIL